MVLSQKEFEDLIDKQKSQKTEKAEIDAKEDLHLITDGDKAFFIHHISAMANNVVPSFLILGIENKTWERKGLSIDSPLMNSDQTQTRMNQILEHKLDPQLSIRYQTYEYAGVMLGLVLVEGGRAPYIISINDDKFGGNRTKGEPCFVYRGVIYVRHGDSTIAANRQSRVLEILNQYKKNEVNPTGIFLAKNNYIDSDLEHYGENDLTKNLVEIIRGITPGKAFDSKAVKSCVSMVFVPTSKECHIETTLLPNKLQPENRIGRDGNWFHGLPRPLIEILWQGKGTPHLFSGKWFPTNPENQIEYTHAINISPSGAIHLAVTYPLFFEWRYEGMNTDLRVFSFVNIIGYFWQMCYLAKAIYKDVDYRDDVLILLNLLGTNGTFLSDLAKGENKTWVTLGDWRYEPNPKDQVQEKHIRVERTTNLVNSSDDEIESLIRGVASELGKYYNQQTPRCFTPDKDQFPVREYSYKNNH